MNAISPSAALLMPGMSGASSSEVDASALPWSGGANAAAGLDMQGFMRLMQPPTESDDEQNDDD